MPSEVVESPAPAMPADLVERPGPPLPADLVERPAPTVPSDAVESPAPATAPDVKSDRAALHRVVALAPGGPGAYIGALALIAVLMPLHSLWAAQVLLVPLLLVVPGAILLQALRVPRGVVSSFPVYVPCASLIVLLGSGLAVDLIGPLVGVAAPLRAGPLLVGLEVVCLALLAKSGNAPSSVAIPWRKFRDQPGLRGRSSSRSPRRPALFGSITVMVPLLQWPRPVLALSCSSRPWWSPGVSTTRYSL